MTKKLVLLLIATAAVTGLAWYTSVKTPQDAEPGDKTANQQSSGLIKVASKAGVGEYLTSSNDLALYTFASDAELKSNCTGTCETNWPPYLIPADREPLVKVESGIMQKINVFERADGSFQYAIGNQPLYLYIGDKKSGDTLGDGINNVWSLAKP